MNVTLFFSEHVTTYMIGWAQSLEGEYHVQEVTHDRKGTGLFLSIGI